MWFSALALLAFTVFYTILGVVILIHLLGNSTEQIKNKWSD